MVSYGGRGPTLNAILWTETFLASIFVFGRIYTRKVILRSVGWDDYCLVATLLLLATYAAFVSAGTAYGLGQLREDVPPEDYIQGMKFEVISQGFCIFNIATSKASVALFLLRIVTKTWHKIFIWFCIVATTIVASLTTIGIFVQCIPVAALWNPAVHGNCWLDFTALGTVGSAWAVCMDFILAIFPFFIIWDLKMKRKDKIITLCGLGLGIFAGICGILRTSALTSLRSFAEYLYDTVDMLIYSGTENFVSSMCASIPVMRPLWIKYVRKYESEDDSHGQGSYKLSDHSTDPERGHRRNVSDGEEGAGGHKTHIYAGRSVFQSMDNDSDEAILEEANGQREVYCKTDIQVDYAVRP